MNGRRRPRHRQRKRQETDPVQQLLDQSLQRPDFYPYYCGEHGKFLSKTRELRPKCPVCNESCFTPEEMKFASASLRELRKIRVSILRNNLE